MLGTKGGGGTGLKFIFSIPKNWKRKTFRFPERVLAVPQGNTKKAARGQARFPGGCTGAGRARKKSKKVRKPSDEVEGFGRKHPWGSEEGHGPQVPRKGARGDEEKVGSAPGA